MRQKEGIIKYRKDVNFEGGPKYGALLIAREREPKYVNILFGNVCYWYFTCWRGMISLPNSVQPLDIYIYI